MIVGYPKKRTSLSHFGVAVLFTIGLLSGCRPSLPAEVASAYEGLPQELDFNVHVKPILSDKCFACHGPDQSKIKGDLQLHLPQMAFRESPNSGVAALTPGNLRESEVFHRIISEDPSYFMPTPESNLALTAREKAVLVKWIEDGAEYKPHWAFEQPKAHEPPPSPWPSTHPIDQFVYQKLAEMGMEPSPTADKELLLRRASLDLTGLPPTLEEIDVFLADNSDDAYEKQVDRLLASPHYGERMAIDWMDVARYADTHGYTVDRYRDMSPWRDWVIKAFNQNMPYDQFVTWQLAGDLMPDATKDQILATGFNRLHPQNMEGGIIDEEFRVEYVADRTAVLGQGLIAMTTACARCHDHKYDPISQKEFFQLYSFFNNVNESGQISWDDATPVPTLLLPTEEQAAIISYLEGQVETESAKLTSVESKEKSSIDQWIEEGHYQNLRAIPPSRGLRAHYALDGRLSNLRNPSEVGRMKRQHSAKEQPNFAEGRTKQGLLLDGDAWLDVSPVGIFKRHHAFTVALWVKIPTDLEEGVIFHKNDGSKIYNFKGYHLYLKDNGLQLMLAHTAPDNAIIEQSIEPVPRDRWTHLAMTYDGSSTAAGLKLYVNGQEAQTHIEVDNLYKDIVFDFEEDKVYENLREPALQVGARWRGKGVGGTTVDDLLVYNLELGAVEILQIANPARLEQLTKKSSTALTAEDRYMLKDHYLRNHSSDHRSQSQSLYLARRALVDSMEQVKEVMVMKEMEQPRTSFVLERGLYDNYGEEVTPNTPSTILEWNEGLPQNRWGLAQWLFDPNHPLTARVAVNRYWQHYFGQGLVTTTEDFGNQGALPTHPELLDWLALEFQQSGWDIKHLQKLIVMSATYRQQSIASKQMLEKDPANTWLARGPKTRLTSEMMRDNALMASGLINTKIGGESIRPYQPEGLWVMNGTRYVPDTGEDLYRRSLYVIWKRTVPHPTLQTFDQPERTECTVRRQKTNTPLQALVLLNDPAYVEACKVIGEDMTKHPDPVEGVAVAFRRLTGRMPQPKEMDILLELREEESRNFRQEPSKIPGWLNIGEYRINPSLDQALVAANTVLASVILNSDASITKR
ncbi:MAG: DUF1553 domain-containing protein [Bacteroidota bacterium]